MNTYPELKKFANNASRRPRDYDWAIKAVRRSLSRGDMARIDRTAEEHCCEQDFWNEVIDALVEGEHTQSLHSLVQYNMEHAKKSGRSEEEINGLIQ